MKTMFERGCLSATLLVAALLFMPACDWFGGSKKAESTKESKAEKKGEFVIKLGNETVLTKDEFNNYLEMNKQMQMQQMPGFDFDALMAQLPEEQQRMYYNSILEMLLNSALISRHVSEQGWDKAEEYEKNLRMMLDEVTKKLAQDECVKRITEKCSVTDKDAERFYNENRTTNPYMQQEQFITKPAGVQAYAVKAKDEAQAKALVSSATTNNRGLKKAATELGLKADDLGTVTYQSTKPDKTIVVKIMSAQKFPTIDMAKAGDVWYVYESASKKDAEYAPFAQVKDFVKQIMQQDMLVKEYQKQIAQLKDNYKVAVNNEFIESLVKKSPASEAKKNELPQDMKMAEEAEAVMV